MNQYEIVVEYSSGGPRRGVAVAVHGSMTHSNGFTDGDGECVLEHSSRASACFVDHRSRGEIHPGRTVVRG